MDDLHWTATPEAVGGRLHQNLAAIACRGRHRLVKPCQECVEAVAPLVRPLGEALLATETGLPRNRPLRAEEADRIGRLLEALEAAATNRAVVLVGGGSAAGR